MPGLAPHAVTKFGVVGLSETLAPELAGTSVGVSVFCPAFVRTHYAENIKRLKALDRATAKANLERPNNDEKAIRSI